jgi:hypothetical protein
MEHPVQCCTDDFNYERESYILYLNEHNDLCFCTNKKIDRSGPGWEPKESGKFVKDFCKNANGQELDNQISSISIHADSNSSNIG